jgi:hypothetical protein
MRVKSPAVKPVQLSQKARAARVQVLVKVKVKEGAGSGEGEPDYVLLKLPARDDPEYTAAFNNLSFDDQVKVESELSALNNNTDPELAKLLNEKLSKTKEGEGEGEGDGSGEKKKEEGGEGEGEGKKTGEGEEATPEFKAVSKEEFAAFPDRAKEALLAMDKEIKSVEEFNKPEVQDGLAKMMSDPIISQRVEQLKSGQEDPYEVTEEMRKGYNPNDHTTLDELKKNIDFSTADKADASLQFVSNLLYEAAQRGHNMASSNFELTAKQITRNAETKAEIEKQLTVMVGANPSMKSELKYVDPKHPLNPFLQWVGVNKISAEQFAKLGVKNVFTMYQSASGKSQQVIDQQIADAKKKVFLDLEEMDDSARTLSKTSQTQKTVTEQMYKGIDLDKYASDPVYRQRMYERAEWNTQLELEKFVVTGEKPKGTQRV